MTYTIATSSPLTNLLANNSACSADGEYQNDCANPWGFAWTDTQSVAPLSIEVQFLLQQSCDSAGPQAIDLNGSAIGTFTNVNACGDASCPTTAIDFTSSSLSSYVVGGTNTLLVPSPACEGINNQGGTLAIVTVTYPGTATYVITPASPLTNLLANNSACSADGEYQNDCANPWGFSWTDTGTGVPLSIEVQFLLQQSCDPSGDQELDLNGSDIGTFANVNACGSPSCPSTPITFSSTQVGSYVIDGVNTLLTPSPACEGINNQSGTLALVTVTYGPVPTCGSPGILCGTQCVDPTSDADNCGGCVPDGGITGPDGGVACQGGEVCSAGTCGCPSSEVLCGATCTDLSSTQDDCGICGFSCSTVTSSTCQPSAPVAGACTCPVATPSACGLELAPLAWSTSSTSSNAGLTAPASPIGNYQQLTYADQSTDVYSQQSFTFQAVAPTSGTYSFTWNYTGYHAYFEAVASLTAFTVDASSQTTDTTLVGNTSVSGGFNISGTTSLDLTAGQLFGFIATGQNDDSDDRLLGTLTLTTQLTCSDPQSDPNNCGGCGNVCPGDAGVCSGGICPPVNLANDALGLAVGPIGIVLDAAGANVYWAANGGSLHQYNIASATDTALFDLGTSNVDRPLHLAVDSQNVYASDENSDILVSVAIASPHTLTTISTGNGGEGEGLAVDDSFIYWCSVANGTVGFVTAGQTQIFQIPRGTGSPVALYSAASSGSFCQDLVIDSPTSASRVYWADSTAGTVNGAPTGTANGNVVLVSGEAGAQAMAIDGTNLYWGDSPANNEVTLKFTPLPTTLGSIAAGAITTAYTTTQAFARVVSLGVDAQNIYWTEPATASLLSYVPLGANGQATVLASTTDAAIQRLAIGSNSNLIYWTGTGGLFETTR